MLSVCSFAAECVLYGFAVRFRGVMRFSCGVCTTRFHSKHELDVHDLTQHSQQRRYQCHLCKKTFHRRSVLRDHIELHAQDTTGTEPLTCAHCGKLFRQNKHFVVATVISHSLMCKNCPYNIYYVLRYLKPSLEPSANVGLDSSVVAL